MKKTQTQNDKAINFSLGDFIGLQGFNKLFDGIKTSLQQEQKELVLGKKNMEETDNYFNFMKFILSSPDKAI
jgi:hypothetical protein